MTSQPRRTCLPCLVISVAPSVAEAKKTALSACLLHAHEAQVHAAEHNGPRCLRLTG